MSTILLKKSDIYLHALNHLERGDYIHGIHWLYRSAKSGFDIDRRIDLAIAYFNIGQYAQALIEFFLALAQDEDNYEILKYIIRCYIELGRIDSAVYYLKYCLEKRIFDEEDLELDEFEITEETPINVIDKKDKFQEIQFAHKLIIAEQYEYAEDLLKSIEPDSYQYLDARNFLAMLSIVMEKPEEAIKYCDEILEKEPKNIMALGQKFAALHLIGDKKGRDEVIEDIKEMKIEDFSDWAKLAVSFKIIGDEEMTMQCFENILKQLPYDRDYLICTAQACFNCGRTERAKQLIVDALRIYPLDATVEYYAHEISARTGTDKFEVLPLIPVAETAVWFSELDNLLHLKPTVAEQKIRTDKSYDLKIRWIFQNDFTGMQLSLVRLLIKNNRYRKYFLEFLLNPFGNIRVKREIISLYMATNPSITEVVFTIEDRFKRMKTKIPENIKQHKYYPAYCKAFAMGAMISDKFVTKLNREYDAIIIAEEKQALGKKPNPNALAAILISKVFGRKFSEEQYCENMECDMTDFKVYKETVYGK